MIDLQLREVRKEDLALFFEFQLDDLASVMAAFTHKDPSSRSAFEVHWSKIMADPSIINRTVVVDNQVVGSVASYLLGVERQVCYWIDRKYWGQGIATRALEELLKLIPDRPLFASAAWDNTGSIRVLEKCGFCYVRTELAYANARGAEIEEEMFILN